jgi:hypothetical protein
MGPEISHNRSTDGPQWAQYSWHVTPPMALNGPGIPRKGYYRRPQMGPALLVEYLADDLEQAQNSSQL